MKNKLKFIVITVILLMLIALGGCTEININASINEDNEVNYSYEVIITKIEREDINYQEAKAYLSKMMKYWQDKEGFKTSLTTDNAQLHMTAWLKEDCDTREEAFQVLYEYMTNSVSPFINVDYNYSQNFYYEDYSLNASINLEDIADEDIYTVYPSIVGDDVDEFFSNLKCTVNISLPHNDSEVSDDITQKVDIFGVPIAGEKHISVSGVINNNENVRYENNLMLTKARQKKTLIILSGAAAVFIALLIVIIILKKKKNKSDTISSTSEPTTTA